jgi:hypothetical protein
LFYRIISLRGEIWDHKASLTPPILFNYGNACTKLGELAVIYLCVRGIDFASFYDFWDFGNVSYYFFSYHTATQPKDFSIGLGSCFHSVVFFSYHTIATIQPKDCTIFLLQFGVVFQYDIFFFILLLNN